MIKKCLVLSAILIFYWQAVSFAKQNSMSNNDSLIGINGSSSYLGNHSTFEQHDLAGLRSLYPPDKRIILSSEGHLSRFIKLSKVAGPIDWFERNSKGDLLYVKSLFKEAVPATFMGLIKAMAETKNRNPKKVVLFFGNHGDKNGPARLDGVITRQEVDMYEKNFDPSTIIQRLHFHCYAGTMLTQNKEAKNIKTAKSLQDLQSFFSKNRCALSQTQEDEMGYSEMDLSAYLLKRPKASLQDIYFYMRVSLAGSVPILTSRLFVQKFAEIQCAALTEATACGQGESCELDSWCNSLHWLKSIRNRNQYYKLASEAISTDLLYKIDDEFKKRNPEEYEEYLRQLQRYQNLIICSELGVFKDFTFTCPQNIDLELIKTLEVLKNTEKKKLELRNDIQLYEKSLDQTEKEFEKSIAHIETAEEREDVKFNVKHWYVIQESSVQYGNTASEFLNEENLYKKFRDQLKSDPQLNELLKSIEACEKLPLGPR